MYFIDNKKIFFQYTLIILNILFLIIMSIELYNILCRSDLNILDLNIPDTLPSVKPYYYLNLLIERQFLNYNIYNYSFSNISILGYTSFFNNKIATGIDIIEFKYYHLFSEEFFFFKRKKELFNYDSLIEIHFFTKVQSSKSIVFECLQDSIFVFNDDPTLVFFRIINFESSDIDCIVVFLVYPTSILTSLIKLQCFCFDNMVVSSFDTVDLPVVFSINVDEYVSKLKLSKKIDIAFFYLFIEK